MIIKTAEGWVELRGKYGAPPVSEANCFHKLEAEKRGDVANIVVVPSAEVFFRKKLAAMMAVAYERLTHAAHPVGYDEKLHICEFEAAAKQYRQELRSLV